jgi:hypothetical protein
MDRGGSRAFPTFLYSALLKAMQRFFPQGVRSRDWIYTENLKLYT